MEQMVLKLYIWVFGIGFTLGGGHYITDYLLHMIREKYVDYEDPDLGKTAIPEWLIGIIERLFFTILVAFNVSGTAIAMLGWITLKMTTNLHYLKADEKGKEVPLGKRMMMFSGLLGGMISMFCALIGGLMIRYS